MVIAGKADNFKQAHELQTSEMVALNYGVPTATVVLKVTGNDMTTLVITVPNSTPVRYLNSE